VPEARVQRDGGRNQRPPRQALALLSGSNTYCSNPDIPLVNNAAASWRSGYAADCKSGNFFCKNNLLKPIRYQDRPATDGESDNSEQS
jgi:hypothetical protein